MNPMPLLPLLLVGTSAAQDAREQRARWVEIRAEIAQEKRDWDAARGVLRDRIATLKRKIAAAEAIRAASTYEELLAGLEQRKASLARLTTSLESLVVDCERRAGVLLARAPAPVRQRLAPLAEELPADPAAAEFSAQRFAIAIGIWNELGRIAAGGPGAEEVAPRDVARRLGQAAAELAALREAIARERAPLAAQVERLDAELARIHGKDLGDAAADADRELAIVVLPKELSRGEETVDYVANLFSDYLHNLRARLDAEAAGSWPRQLGAVLSVSANPDIGKEEVFAAQTTAISRSMARIEEAFATSGPPPARETDKE